MSTRLAPTVQPPGTVPNARFSFEGVERIPADEACILVFNHRSYFDPTAIGLLVGKSGRSARFLGKKEVFDVPIVGRLGRMLGGIRVDRGTGSDEPLDKAPALKIGELVAMAPQGTIRAAPPSSTRNSPAAGVPPSLPTRPGLRSFRSACGAPKVWRRRPPPHLDLRNPPEVTVVVGEPVDLTYRSVDGDTARIMSAIVELLPPEGESRTPTAEELAATYPPGYCGDLLNGRRPGSDT